MARINYYQFPVGVDAQTRWENGADRIGDGDCTLRPGQSCEGCPTGLAWWDCPHATVEDAEDIVSGITITAAKNLLRQFGGSAWTHHIERDGGVFETTEITLKGNNSRHKYNRHL